MADTDLTYRAIAELTVGDVYSTPTGATIHSGNEIVDLPTGPDPTRCRPCALALWISGLQLAARTATVRVARAVDRAAPLTPDRPHICRQPVPVTDGALPLLPASSPWGQLDLDSTPLTCRAVSRLARDEGPRNHRHHPPPAGEAPTPPPASPSSVPLEPLDPARAAAVRHATAAALKTVTAALDAVDAAAAELERRTAALLSRLE